jgi:predicted metal-dependent phosphoesterase TrpH
MILRGMAHVHSRWSYDGCHDLDEIVARAAGRRLDFVLMSEHNRTLTDDTMAAFVAQCDALTRPGGVLVVPGIECEATPDYVHVLGYGVRTLIRDRRAGAIAAAVRAAGGVPVLAHPVYRDAAAHVSTADLAQVVGWEVWNGKADGRWYPNTDAVRRLIELHRGGVGLVPMVGADLHRLEADPGLVLEVTCDTHTAEAILGALQRRAYRAVGAAWSFDAADPLREPPLSLRRVAAAAAVDVRRGAKRLHGWLARRGLRAPASMTGAARRLLK